MKSIIKQKLGEQLSKESVLMDFFKLKKMLSFNFLENQQISVFKTL